MNRFSSKSHKSLNVSLPQLLQRATEHWHATCPQRNKLPTIKERRLSVFEEHEVLPSPTMLCRTDARGYANKLTFPLREGDFKGDFMI